MISYTEQIMYNLYKDNVYGDWGENMKVTREMLHQMLDQVEEKELPKVYDLFQSMLEGDDFISDVEKAEVKEAKKRINNGDFVTFDELLKDNAEN
ncbi:hypothetical protein [Bacillus cereus]|uniref:hypothetical protein n=1 Tax=Bacillus cereus TaxID=1396 RepID=UPI00187A4ADE|nr:hypothetical protein [Bacillus cereus]MBE7123427.1 hypothetical protein [Bacillus cereus]